MPGLVPLNYSVKQLADSNVIDKEGFDVSSYKSLAQKFPKVVLSDKPELTEILISARVPQYQQQQPTAPPNSHPPISSMALMNSLRERPDGPWRHGHVPMAGSEIPPQSPI